jgi:hypothetical protein
MAGQQPRRAADGYTPTSSPRLTREVAQHGGVTVSLNAHVVCAHCTDADDYFADADGPPPAAFRAAADAHFRALGWAVGGPGARVLCPACARAG